MGARKSGAAKRSANRAAANLKKTAREIEPEADARAREAANAKAAGEEGSHDANPDVGTDSSVRHAEPQTGHRAGEGHGGYPSGEYDVTKPPPAGPSRTKGDTKAALEQHFAVSPGVDAQLERAKKNERLKGDQWDKALEAMPVGTIIERTDFDWRARVVGTNRNASAPTFSEMIEAFVLGDVAPQTLDRETVLKQLEPRQRKEVEERDRLAAERVGAPGSERYEREQAQRVGAQAQIAAAAMRPVERER